MERLVTTSQAAQILGLTVQGVHYRIKTNKLKSIKKSGRVYVYIDDNTKAKPEISSKNLKKDDVFQKRDYEKYSKLIIKGKNEQISILKKSIKWMKKQYTSEIERLEKNQKRVIEVFNSEIRLLQSAFNEMRAIYKPQIEDKNEKKDFMSIKEFFIMFKRYGKTNYEIKRIILEAIKNGDKRFIYNKNEKKILILNSSFRDLL